jgi:alpha-ketoglutarate-dependent taurine dioxygenase
VRRYSGGYADPKREGDSVHRVEAAGGTVHDASGTAMLSTTTDAFDLHTDEAYLPAPARYLLLHCWRADEAGGVNLLADIASVLPRLDPWAAEACHRVTFRWSALDAPILTPVPGRAWPRVRFNRKARVDRCAGSAASDKERYLPETFLIAARAAAVACPLAPGDCLITDNWRVLHGRTGFGPQSPRLLKRVRVLDDAGPSGLAPVHSRKRASTPAGR